MTSKIKLFTYSACGNTSQPLCQDYFSSQNILDYSKIINQSNTTNKYSFKFGYNHFIIIPSQFYNLDSFYTGQIPAILISCGKSSSSCLYIETTNHSYSDHFCGYGLIDNSTKCQNSFAKLNQDQNWKLLITLNTNFIPGLSKIFNYNISFNKIYTNPNLTYSNLTVYNSLTKILMNSATIQFAGLFIFGKIIGSC